MKLEEIGFYTLSDKRAEDCSFSSPLKRCELILTDACNFRCSYCRGLGMDLRGSMSYDLAKDIVGWWADDGLENIRFSGGEPCLYKGLKELVSYSRGLGIKRIAVSTNGSMDYRYYEELCKFGVNDFSISLDACCSSTGNMMSGVDMWDRVIVNIEKVSKLCYTTVGVVINGENINEVGRKFIWLIRWG